MAKKRKRRLRGTRLEDPMWKRRMIARDTLIGLPPGPRYPYDLYKRNLLANGIELPHHNTMRSDMEWAREAIMAMPEAKEVKSWLTNLMMFTTSKSYQDGKMNNAIAAGKLLAELTGALAPQVVEDNSVNIAAYLAGSTEEQGDIIDAEQGGTSESAQIEGPDRQLGF